MRKLNKVKKWAALCLATCLALGLTACGGNGDGNKDGSDGGGASNSKDASGVELVATRWSGGQSDDQKELVKSYTDATIVIDDVAYDKLKEKETINMQKNGTGDYDLIYVAEVWCPDYVKNGWLVPLNDYIEKYGVDTGIYNQSLLDAMTVDGQIYALPTFTQTSILAYDEEAMERYGKGVPETFDELIECAKWFKENEGTGIAIPAMQGQSAIDLFGGILYSCGGEFVEDGELVLDSEEAAQAIDIWQQLCLYSMEGSSTWHIDDVAQVVKDGNAPISISMSGVCSPYLDPEQSAVAETIRFAKMPTINGNDYVGTANFWGWSVAKNSANPEEAFQAIVWLTSEEQEKSAALANGSLAAIPSLAEDPEILEQIPYLPAATETLAHARILPTVGDSSAMMTDLQAVLSQIAEKPDGVDAKALLKEFNADCQDYDFNP
jgi:ABC-type glycerol-3-phosphate transport system substrate-binding protein